MEKLNPAALAQSGDDELDNRPGVQAVDRPMILDYVLSEHMLPDYSARPFAAWLEDEWGDFNEDGTRTNKDVIEGAVIEWCGGRT